MSASLTTNLALGWQLAGTENSRVSFETFHAGIIANESSPRPHETRKSQSYTGRRANRTPADVAVNAANYHSSLVWDDDRAPQQMATESFPTVRPETALNLAARTLGPVRPDFRPTKAPVEVSYGEITQTYQQAQTVLMDETWAKSVEDIYAARIADEASRESFKAPVKKAPRKTRKTAASQISDEAQANAALEAIFAAMAA